ncbi:hypothetical protein DL98DRAFT_617254 [Cadophora sp. DSE1049]|nr:hypothetical protein DL98DRAFT_617254 [Cadophora sp. DSE1049]
MSTRLGSRYALSTPQTRINSGRSVSELSSPTYTIREQETRNRKLKGSISIITTSQNVQNIQIMAIQTSRSDAEIGREMSIEGRMTADGPGQGNLLDDEKPTSSNPMSLEYMTGSDSSSPEQNARSCTHGELARTKTELEWMKADLAESKEETASLRDLRNMPASQLTINELDDQVGYLKQIVKKQELDKHYHAIYMCRSTMELKEKTKQYDGLLAAVRKIASGDEELKRRLKAFGVDVGEGGSAMERADSKWDNQS